MSDRYPIGYRFTTPGLGSCRITRHIEQTAEQFLQALPTFGDYLIRPGDGSGKAIVTHEFVRDCGTPEPSPDVRP